MIVDAASMKGRMKSAQDVSRDGRGGPVANEDMPPESAGPPREGIIKVIE
jgi:hypothetical protein